jgi:hypothetical protein
MSETVSKFLDGVRPWRLISGGLRVQSASLRATLVITLVSWVLLQVADRSDRGLAIVVFCGGQMLLAVAQVVALALFILGPENETRRQARRTGWLVVTAIVLLVVMVATAFWPARLGALPDTARQQIATVAFVSLLVNVAILGFLWLRIHAALGRDCNNPRLAFFADRFADAWIGLSACVGALIVWDLARMPLSAADPLQSMLTAVMVTILEALYLVLVAWSVRVLDAAARRRDVVLN